MVSPKQSTAHTPPLTARVVALQLLHAVLIKRLTVEDTLSNTPALASLSKPDSGFARALLMASLRHLGQAECLIEKLVERPLDAKLFHVKHSLILGIVQILWLDTPAHAAVSETVEAVRALKFEKMTGFVNATLKRVAKDKDTLKAELDGRATRNFPDWLYESWGDAYGMENMKKMAACAQEIPPLDLSFKTEESAKAWAQTNGAEHLWGGAVRVKDAANVELLAGFEAGEWWVQDVAAQVPAQLLGALAGKRVMDVCAAPGGKTAQLIAAGAKVTAVDISKKRLQRLEDNLARLNMSAEVQEGDATEIVSRETFDAVLLDAPCSATGTLRRHPELLWQRTPEDMGRLCVLQHKLLRQAKQWVKKGGVVIYAVCSLQPEEGKKQVDGFLSANPEWQRAPISTQEFTWLPAPWVTKEGDFQCLPTNEVLSDGADGFYAARLVYKG